jgi:AbrB family looped-hinge helix DNA binding protein
MRDSNTARLSARFHVFIPKNVRDAMGWKVGQEFVFITKGNGVRLMPVPGLDQLAGLLRGANRKDVRDRTNRV